MLYLRKCKIVVRLNISIALAIFVIFLFGLNDKSQMRCFKNAKEYDCYLHYVHE